MHRFNAFLALAGLTVAGLLVGPRSSHAYALMGEELDLTQRDFRIFANFSDPTVIDNLVADPDYPGASGAVMAVWKGVMEWGSELHGSGVTDPFNADGLGSGGANFDPYFLGYATGPGGVNSNTISQIDGFGGGTLAFTSIPIGDGWRIRFFEDPTEWHDGPGGPTSSQNNAWDLQGVAAHEFGHALGLFHSTVTDATMFPSADVIQTNHGLNMRSLAPDDMAGVQAIYGVKSPNKPHITSYELTATGIAILGERFDANDNEVWWTRTSLTTPLEDDYLVSSGVPATLGGTRIDVVPPPDAGPGDILVKLPATDYASVSNAFPFDPTRDRCLAPFVFGDAKPTSTGSLPELTTVGLPTVGFQRFLICTDGGVAGESGLLLSASSMASTPFFGGTLYLGAGLRRERAFTFDASGSTRVITPIAAGLVGLTRYYQLWFRDPADPHGVGLSNALEVTFCP
jgi:hypothetical protein